MSVAIHGVLVEPLPGGPSKLLRTGPCLAAPPRVERWQCLACHARWWAPSRANPRNRLKCPFCQNARGPGYVSSDGSRALVVAWAGEIVVDGVDRLIRSAYHNHDGDEDIRNLVAELLDGNLDAMFDAWHAALGSWVLVDADGKEVAR